jgi:hypothetical protein
VALTGQARITAILRLGSRRLERFTIEPVQSSPASIV